MEEAVKHDQLKPNISLFPSDVLFEVSKTFTYGAKKYEKWNYSKGMEYTRYTSAAMRHISQALMGEDIDEDSKCYHLSNAIASLSMCLHNQLNGKIVDDRNPVYKQIKNDKHSTNT